MVVRGSFIQLDEFAQVGKLSTLATKRSNGDSLWLKLSSL